ncbi:MAG: TolC family protein [bacterium]
MKNKTANSLNKTLAAAAILFALLAPRAFAADIQAPITLSIDDAVRFALENNPMLAASQGDADAAAARTSMAASQRKPSLSTTSFLADGDMPGILNGPSSVMPAATNSYMAKRYYNQNLMLMFPLDVSQRLKRNASGASRLGDAAASDYERSRQNLVQQVRAMYYEIQFQDARADAYKAAFDVAEEQLRIDVSSVEAGKIPAYYLERDRAESAMSEQFLAESRRDADTMRVQLAAMLGVDPSTPLRLTTELKTPDVPANTAPASDKLPEIAALQSRVKAAAASSEAAKRAGRPDISIVLMSGRTASQNNDTMTGTTTAVIAAFPLFDGGMRHAAAKEALAMRSAAENELKSMDLNIKAAYQTARLEYETALKNISTTEKALVSAEENYRVAKIRYEAGKSILVEMLDAKSALTAARVNRAQAIRDSLVANDKLLRLSGAFADNPKH